MTAIDDLVAKQAISEVVYRYCRALDRMDRALADTVWHAGGTADYGPTYEGSASGLLDQMWVDHARLAGHSHQVTNILIELSGDEAASESYATGSLWNVTEAGRLVRLEALGRYLDRWSCRDGVWAIDHRQFVYDAVFTQVNASVEDADGDRLIRLASRRDPRATLGRRDRTDPSYDFLVL